MPRNPKRHPGARKYKDYSKESLQKAIEAVNSGKSTLRKAAEEFGISRATISRRINGENAGKVGRPCVLLEEDERSLVQCITAAGEWGFPLTLFDIRLLVKSFLDKKGVTEKRFCNNLPGKDWGMSFLKRQKNILSQRLCQNVKRARANVDEETITAYFDELQTNLEGVDAHLIINYDETNLTDDPGRKHVVVRRGCRHPERIIDTTKSSTSVMFTAVGNGVLLPPYITYKAEHLYNTWTEGGPKGTVFNRSKSGWFTMEIFEDWFRSIILPYFKKYDTEAPKVLIGDNLASHVSPWVISQCEKLNIRFILLPPNSTGICQPLDVSFFRPLKAYWRSVLGEWKETNRGSIPKDKFPCLLSKCLNAMTSDCEKNIKAGFKATGLVPLDRQQVLKRLPRTTVLSQSNDENNITWVSSLETLLQEKRSNETQPMKQKKKKLNIPAGRSIVQNMLNDDVEQGSPSQGTVKKGTGKERKGKRTHNESHLSSSSEDEGLFSVHDTDSDDVISFCSSGKENETEGSEIPEQSSSNVNTIFSSDSPVHSDDILSGVFVVVKLKYNENTKKECVKTFYGQVISNDNDGQCRVKFLRKSSKNNKIYIFPIVDDVMKIRLDQIVSTVKPLGVSRGRYTFPFELS